MNKKFMMLLWGGKGGGGVDGKIKLKKFGLRFIKLGSWKEGGVVEG